MIVAACVIGPNNQPLYLSTFSSDDESARLSTLVHCSLDAVEEKVAGRLRGLAGEAPDAYLGVLATEEELRVYGYWTNTQAKLCVVVDDLVVKDDEMRAIFRRMHAAYVDAVSNPFYVMGTPLTSPRFDASIRTIATSLGALA